MKRELLLGIDPGFTGALAWIDRHTLKLVELSDMPLSKTEKNKNQIDLPALSLLIESFAKETLLAVIEKVGPRPDEGVSSVFKFGYGAGALAGVIVANSIPIFFAEPSVWKALMKVTSDKKTSLELARKRFPDNIAQFKRQKDNGRAEAALLALFGAERLVGK